ncbi:hypothetical protein [Allosalinactinospora lopnorensis]|uniref:hypothetical protein n=1 Tax=Allosalinactinospora lopnorensis TaxID=1352348 RepID=UPI000623DED6|nr:hypothetical protein [Allosalinactinospora lopnorensis]
MPEERLDRVQMRLDVVEKRIRILESQVSTLTEAIRVLVHGLEGTPIAQPGEEQRSAGQAARQAHELLLLTEQASQRPER